MNRLSALDASFIYGETSETPMNVGSLAIFAPPANPDDVFARFRDHTAARLDQLPLYRRRLEMTPLGLNHPAWVDDDDFDLDYHIRRDALPKPGTMKQLRALVARLHALPLDHSRPLWQYHMIEGLKDGGFAVYFKFHHCDMDGLAHMATLDAMYDFLPNSAPAPRLRRATLSAAPPPGFLELTTTAAADFLRQRFRAVRSLPNLAWTLAKASRTLGRDVQYSLAYVWKTPRTRFNVAVSSQRSYGTASLSLPDVKALAKARNVTINDVVLAVCAGALRRYLIERQSLPDLPLTAAVPASLRAPGDNRMNNQLMFLLCRLATNVSDPLVRLAATQVAAREAKNLLADVKDLVTADVPVLGAPTIMTALYQLLQRTNSAWWNVVISNVPGPRQPIHCADAAGRHYFPLSALMHGCALNITVFGYVDLLEFGLTACRTAAPDVQLIGDYLVEDFEAMQRASAALGRPDAVATIEIARPRSLLTREAKLEGPAAKPRLTRVSAKGAEASVRAKRASVKQPPATAETNAEAEPAEKKTKRRQAANPRARPRAPERVAGT